jgi:hypothetical protein
MKKDTRIRVAADGGRGFFDRAREHARKLDRGEELAPEITISLRRMVEPRAGRYQLVAAI